jgi:hypothetical protein
LPNISRDGFLMTTERKKKIIHTKQRELKDEHLGTYINKKQNKLV